MRILDSMTMQLDVLPQLYRNFKDTRLQVFVVYLDMNQSYNIRLMKAIKG